MTLAASVASVGPMAAGALVEAPGAIESLPTWFPVASVNQTFPSPPAVMPSGAFVRFVVNSVMTPAGVIWPSSPEP